MPVLALPAAALAWLGRQGTRAVAVSIFLGLALPQLAATFKPWVAEAIFLLLVLAFLRVEPRELRSYFVRPRLIALATLWIMVVAPAAFGVAFVLLGLHETSPAIFLALVLQASAAPIMSAPAFAALMGLDAALSLATLMACVAVTPITAPIFAHLFAGGTFTLSPLALGAKLFVLLGGSSLLAWIIRRAAGSAWVARQKERIDGLNVITLFVFAVAVMDGVAVTAWTRPFFVLGLLALTFAIALGSMALTALLFLAAGRGRAAAIGWSAANRNMGLMLAAMGGVLPDLAWLYMGLAQFPIYLLPLLLQPAVRRFGSGDR
jgi:BASS family bile acid:Na+ symporter